MLEALRRQKAQQTRAQGLRGSENAGPAAGGRKRALSPAAFHGPAAGPRVLPSRELTHQVSAVSDDGEETTAARSGRIVSGLRRILASRGINYPSRGQLHGQHGQGSERGQPARDASRGEVASVAIAQGRRGTLGPFLTFATQAEAFGAADALAAGATIDLAVAASAGPQALARVMSTRMRAGFFFFFFLYNQNGLAHC
jgi:hypothetical protein